MILTVPLQPGTVLANVRYKWMANGVQGVEQTSGITQPDATIPVFRFNVTPPAGAEEMIAYDVTDPTGNWNVAGYKIAALGPELAEFTTVPGFGWNALTLRTVTFKSVLHALTRLMGEAPSDDFDNDDARVRTEAINLWVGKIWPAKDWPDWTLIEQRTPVNHYVDVDAPTMIGRVWKVHLVDPRLYDGPFNTPFRQDEGGLYVGLDHGPTVWVKFGLREPTFSSEKYDVTKTYAAADVAYDPGTGNCFISLVNANIGNPLTDGTKWAVVPFPKPIYDPVLRGAYAHALREDGQEDKALEEEKLVIADLAMRFGVYLAPENNELTDQATPRSRYALAS